MAAHLVGSHNITHRHLDFPDIRCESSCHLSVLGVLPLAVILVVSNCGFHAMYRDEKRIGCIAEQQHA